MAHHITFYEPDSINIIENVKTTTTIFSIIENGNGDLLLSCKISEYEIYKFYIEPTNILRRCINMQVDYGSSWITFIDEFEWDTYSELSDSDCDVANTKCILDTDYCIPDMDIEECPVCYDTFEVFFGSNCGHYVCTPCMRKMDEKHIYNCPMCRSDVFKYPIAIACNRDFVWV